MAIDFREFQRGQAEGRRALDEAQRFKANESTYALQELNNIYAMQDLNIGRQAAAYLAPLATHRQRAAQQGVDPIDFLVSQQQAMLADPNFQNFSADVQQAVNEKFQQQVSMTAETLIKNKDFSGLQKLVDSLGVVSPVGDADQASMTADVGGLVTALASQGVPATVTAEGTIEVNGMKIDPVRFNALYSQYNGNIALALGAYQQEVKDQTQLDEAQQITKAGLLAGTILGSDGNYYNSATGNLMFSKEVADMIGVPTEGGTFTPGSTPVSTSVVDTTTLTPEGTTETVDVTQTSAPTTGVGEVVRLQQQVLTEGTDTLSVDQLQVVADSPKPSFETVYTPEEIVQLNDSRTPAVTRVALQQKMVKAQQEYAEAQRKVRLAITEAQPQAPVVADFFPDPADQRKLNTYMTSIASGAGSQIATALANETPEFQAAFESLQEANRRYQQLLKGTK